MVENIHLAQIASLGQYSGGLASILEVLFAINALLSSVTALSDFIRIRIPLGQKPKS